MSDAGWAERRKLAQAIAALADDTSRKMDDDNKSRHDLLEDLLTRLSDLTANIAPETVEWFPALLCFRGTRTVYPLLSEDD